MATLRCDIVTPAERLFSEECYMVAVPGEAGHMGFLPGHAPLMSTLANGEVRVYSDATTLVERFVCQGGYVQVTGDKVIVLTDRAAAASGIDAAQVSSDIAELEAQLAAMDPEDGKRSVVEYDLAWNRALAAATEAK